MSFTLRPISSATTRTRPGTSSRISSSNPRPSTSTSNRNQTMSTDTTTSMRGAVLGGSFAQQSMDELRSRRLAALGATATTSQTQPANAAVATNVIDLCSDDENDTKQPGVNNKKSKASENGGDDENSVDLVAQFQELQRRKRARLAQEKTENTQRTRVSQSEQESPELIAAEAMSRASSTNSNRGNVSDRRPATSTAQRSQSSSSSSSDQVPTKIRKPGTSSQAVISSQSSIATRFQIATYNIWFQPLHERARMQAISQLLLSKHQSEEDPLWFIAFQEVMEPLSNFLFPALEAAGYNIVRQPQHRIPYGCALAVHNSLTILDSNFVPYTRTGMERGILYARARLPHTSPPQQVLFTTTHLESYAGDIDGSGHIYTGSAERQAQVLELEEFCFQQQEEHPELRAVIITGDLNWDDERARSVGTEPALLSHLQRPWQDAWIECRSRMTAAQQKQNLGYTYDAKVSPMLGGSLRRRFDRVLLLQSNRCLVRGMDMIGTQALPGLTWEKRNPYNNHSRKVPVTPSDHFGLVVQLELQGEKK